MHRGQKKGEISRLNNKTLIKSDHGQNSPVVIVLFTVLTMIRNWLDQKDEESWSTLVRGEQLLDIAEKSQASTITENIEACSS